MKKSFLRSTLLAALMATLYGQAQAAGLGRINVFSALGQPLRAEVELSATADELEAMSAKLASAEAHARSRIDYIPDFANIRMSVERRGPAGAVVKISSDRPFNEPFVDFLVELNWGGGRVVREYTFLLDPAESAGSKALPQIGEPAVRAERPAPLSAPAPAPEVRESVAPASKPARSARTARAAKAAEPKKAAEPEAAASKDRPEDYKVQPGNTASGIAEKLKSVEITRDQMMAALYRSNQSAFAGGNINKLAAGSILKVPSIQDAAQIERSEARQIIVKASSFEALKQDAAAAVAQGAAKDAQGGQSASGKLSSKVEEKSPLAAPGKDQLKISKTQLDKQAGAGLSDSKASGRIQALEEDAAAREKALKEAKSRTAELERNVKELEKLVKLKNDSLAEAQKQAAAAEAKAKELSKAVDDKASKAADKAAKEKAAADEKAAKLKAEADAKAAQEQAAKEKAEADKLAAEKDAAEKAAAEEAAAREKAAKEAAEAQSAAQASASEPVEASPPLAQSAAPVASAPVSAPVAEEPKPEEPGILSSPLTLGVAALALLLGALVFIRNRRRNAAATASTTTLSDASTSPNSVFGNAGGQTIDTGTSVLHTDFSQSGLSAIDTDEGVDPVAEADVYMAYGRDAQAEEILLDALKNDPTRTAIYLKLLEIYAQRRSLKQFETIATDLYTQTGGVGEDWAKAAALGARLDPGNPLYGSPQPAAAPAPAPVVAEPAPEPMAAPIVSFGNGDAADMRSTWTMPGEISKFTDQGDLVEDEMPQSLTATTPEPLNLDFNLDLELPAGDEPETRIESRDEEPLSLEPEPLSLDAGNASAEVDMPLEFDIGDDEPAHALSTPISASEEEEIDKAMNALMATDIHTRPLTADELPQAVAEVDLEKTNFETSLLDFDFELGEDTNITRTGLNVADASSPDPVASEAAPAAAAQAGADDLPDEIDINDEVSTKLELARAYEEMGDVEGARELLEEVINDGAEKQKEQARSLLSRLA
jgi:pilus assembly protein FimV